MFGFRSMLGKIGKAAQSQIRLSADLATQRRDRFGELPFGNSGLWPEKKSADLTKSHERAKARSLLSRACKQAQANGQVTLTYEDALYVLNVLNRVESDTK
jgi:hypothetical protein